MEVFFVCLIINVASGVVVSALPSCVFKKGDLNTTFTKVAEESSEYECHVLCADRRSTHPDTNGAIYGSDSKGCWCFENGFVSVGTAHSSTCQFGPSEKAPAFEVERSSNDPLTPGEQINIGIAMEIENFQYPRTIVYEIESSVTNNRSDLYTSLVQQKCDTTECENTKTVSAGYYGRYPNAITNGIHHFKRATLDVKNVVLNSNSGNVWKYITPTKMADNPALASGENATVIIATSVGEEYLFVQEEAIEKKKNSWNAADIEIEVTPEVTPKMKTILPGIRRARKVTLKNVGNNSATNLQIFARFPRHVKGVKNYMDFLPSSPLSNFGKEFYEVQIEDGVTSYKVPYFDPTIGAMKAWIPFSVREENEHLLPRYMFPDVPFSVFLEIRYCPYDYCPGGLPTTSRFSRIDMVFTRRPHGEIKTFRLKDVTTGACAMQVGNDEDIRFYGGHCFATFNMAPYSIIVDTARSNQEKKYLHFSEGKIQLSKNNVSIIQNKFHQLVQLSSQGFEVTHNVSNGVAGTSNVIDYPDTGIPYNGAMTGKYKLLQVWDNIDELQLRSVLSFTFDSHQYIVVCNPTGDLGNKFNCFYTLVVDSVVKSWTVLSSYITNVLFFNPTDNILYGKGNRGKSYFKLVLPNLSRVFGVQESDFLAAKTSPSTIHATRLDQSDQNEVPSATPFANVKASMKGVYFVESNGAEVLIFMFGD